ncbi:MAG: ATP-binding protein [Bacteroidetes bacterium]|nr:ATP-binding protein [Bacteroidota bacterium]MBU1719738.1 ATP-binding protein [Bacteroidota bacterium]
MYLERNIDNELLGWKNQTNGRKPLLIRGARQVGKSTAVRELAKKFDFFVEVNFEEHKQAHSLFQGDLSPKEICSDLSVLFHIPIVAGKTLLFFDEIQQCLPAITSLRYFYEKFPELHIIAAGLLLEFALEELPSFGVGRIRSIFMYSFSFNEFLIACGERQLLDLKSAASPAKPLAEVFHNKLLKLFKIHMIIGGMPEVVQEYSSSRDIEACQQVIDDIQISLKADFTKYKTRVPASRLSEVFMAVSSQAGGKFVYTKIHSESNHRQLKESIELLIKAGLVIPVTHSSANGIPLGAQQDTKKRKMLMFDTGIFQRLLGLEISDVLFHDEFSFINKGAVAEISVGLELMKYLSTHKEPELFYWQREASSANAEVDYLIQKGKTIMPIEVKSGTKGSMQSLFILLNEKRIKKGYRVSNENFSTYNNIDTYPMYAISELIGNTK